MSAEQELRATLERVAQAFDGVHVAWAVGGSFASTVHGEPRASNDLDVIANLRLAHVSEFVRALGSDFYADEVAIREAVAKRDSFNVIDERSFLKIDVFVPPAGPLGEGQLARRRTFSLSGAGSAVFVLGPEDTVLQKLRWYDLGGRTSDRQWRDILGVIRLGGELDLSYLREVAESGNLTELLDRALAEGGR
jgi:hypothetical protein